MMKYTNKCIDDVRALVRDGKSPREIYDALMTARPSLGHAPAGGVHVALAAAQISHIEREVGARYEAEGLPIVWAEVGVHYADPYVMMLRDAVVFPDGTVGVHHRLLTYGEEPSGVAVLPRYDGRILVMRHFRHPLRSWSWEVPRGAKEPGEATIDTVRREAREEIGAQLENIVSLGSMCGTGGIASMVVDLFIADAITLGASATSEGIGEQRLMTISEFEECAASGEILDAFTIGCFFHARFRGLL